MKSNKCRKEKCLDFRLFIAIAKNHTVNHTSNEEWGFPRHVHAGKPHSGLGFFSLQMLLGLCSLGGYIHLISACRVVWFCHCQQTFSNQGRDIYPFEVYSVFQIKHIHYFQKTFWFFAEIQNQRSHQVFLRAFLDGFS